MSHPGRRSGESTDHEELWLRETLSDAVDDVEPRTGLDGIQAALEAGSRRRRRRVAAGAGLLVAATVTGIALTAGIWDSDPAAAPAGPAPTNGNPEADESSEAEPVEQDEEGLDGSGGPLPVYYLGDTPAGPRLYREFRASTVTGDALDLAVNMAVSVEPLDPDYYMPWPSGTTASAGRLLEPDGVVQVELDSPVDLSESPDGVSPAEARLMIQQLVYTVQAAEQERVDVVFAREGRPFERLLGEEIAFATSEVDPTTVQAPVWVISPQEGKRTDGRVQVEGRGAFFEANVSWQVLQDGEVVRDGFATAEECCTLSPFSFTLPELPDGDYVLRVYDADVSGGEGPGEQEDTKSFSIGPVAG